MQPRKLVLFCVLMRLVFVAIAANAGPRHYINSNLVTLETRPTTVFQAKYRLSNANFDMSIDRGQGTNPGQFISQNLGQNATLSNRPICFSLTHIAGEGLIFRMWDGDSIDHTLSWGSFTSPPAGTTATTLDGQNWGSAFNTLWFDVQATRTNDPGSSMKIEDLTFFSASIPHAHGAFRISHVITPAGGPAAVNQSQWLFSTANLAAHNWILTGKLTGMRDSVASGDETVKVTIKGQQHTGAILLHPTFRQTSFSLLDIAGAGLIMWGVSSMDQTSHVITRTGGLAAANPIKGPQRTGEIIPEPAFYQISILLALGGIGLWRMRRKKQLCLSFWQ